MTTVYDDYDDMGFSDEQLCVAMEEFERSSVTLAPAKQMVPYAIPSADPISVLRGIDMATGLLTKPDEASKAARYLCPVCRDKIYLKTGSIRRRHFSHFPRSLCQLYQGGESELHKYGKMLVKRFLDDGGIILFRTPWRQCTMVSGRFPCSNMVDPNDISSVSKDIDDTVELEYNGPGRRWIADVAIVSGGTEVKVIIEVTNTHATGTGRPEPWYEVDAREACDLPNGEPGMLSSLTDIRRDRAALCGGCQLVGAEWLLRIPKLRKKVGSEGSWLQEGPCILCKRTNYNPRFERGFRQCCKICLGSRTDEVKTMLGVK
jgi:competence protein CoiA-like protein